MEHIKDYIITLVTALVFITAVEMISPDKPIKKYIKFVLGVIFLSVMINPIIYILTKGETEILTTIKKYENNFADELNNSRSKTTNEVREQSFKENLNRNCEKMLSEKFKGFNFKPEIQSTFNFDDMTYTIDEVYIGVNDKSVKLIEKIKINIGESKEALSNDESIENEEEIITYLIDLLNVPREKIEIYSLEGR